MPPTNHPRTRTHTLPDERAFILLGRVPRRKSASSLPAASAHRRRTPSSPNLGVASSTASAIASNSSSSLPPLPPHPIVATSATAPTTPSVLSPAPSTIGPWSGTFLDAGPDADADSDDANDHGDSFYDAPEPESDSGVNHIFASLPELRERSTSRSQSLSQPSPLQISYRTKSLPQVPPQDQSPTSLPPPLKPSNNARDSFISILDDPFFQRYHSPSTDWFGDYGPLHGSSTPSLPPDPAVLAFAATAAASFRIGTGAASGDDHTSLDEKSESRDDKSAWPPPRRESLTVTDQGLWVSAFCIIFPHLNDNC